jgi:hypothetical protein
MIWATSIIVGVVCDYALDLGWLGLGCAPSSALRSLVLDLARGSGIEVQIQGVCILC